MPSPSDLARSAAVHFEAKKDGLQQQQSGQWVLKLKTLPGDMPESLMRAGMGTRFMVALVEIGDDEMPVAPVAQRTEHRASNAKVAGSKPAGGSTRHWGDMPRSQRAGIRCSEPAFLRFLIEEHGASPEDDPAAIVRALCFVDSRADLDKNSRAAVEWDRLDDNYRFWLAHPEAA